MAGVFALNSCTSIDDIQPESGTLTQAQFEETTEAIPSRADAVYTGMYSKLGDPLSFGMFSSSRPDDFSFIMMAYSNDLEAADIVTANNGYNWFSPCMELSSRNADYANPYIRYRGCYDEVSRAHDVMNAYGREATEETSADTRYIIGQAYAIRAFSYLNLAPYFQFNYQIAPDDPCVPIVTLDTEDTANNPRATVSEVYELIVSDLTIAIEYLDGYTRPDKSKIDQQVAYGLRARAYLDMGMWQEAYDDAVRAADGYTPASIAEVSVPAFYNINDHNWLWGYDMTLDIASTYPFATSSSWLRSFSGYSYSAAVGVYARCNKLLYDKIPSTDVRKGWWVDENLESPLLEGLTWGSFTGNDIPSGTIDDEKVAFDQYTNVKFGCYTVGTVTNEEDWPFMRVEEMILIQAECLVRLGRESEGVAVLEDFVQTYRDPSYLLATSAGSTTLDKIWFQRRVELWGEGFGTSDLRRLNKPLVRFHDRAADSNFPDAYAFNLPADDPWLLMRFCTDEINNNLGIVDNTGGSLPSSGQNSELRDGVTD